MGAKKARLSPTKNQMRSLQRDVKLQREQKNEKFVTFASGLVALDFTSKSKCMARPGRAWILMGSDSAQTVRWPMEVTPACLTSTTMTKTGTSELKSRETHGPHGTAEPL